MLEFKKKRAKRIDDSILEILEKEGRPISTSDISLKTKYSWHSVTNHCLRLQMAGKIDGYKIGNINVWVTKK